MSAYRALRRLAPVLTTALLLTALSHARAGGSPPAATDQDGYRIRIENTRFGKIEVSADHGAHYALIGRVVCAVSGVSTLAREGAAGEVVAAGPAVIQIAVSSRHGFVISAASPGNRHGASGTGGIVTNDLPGTGMFGSLRPVLHTRARLQGVSSIVPLPDDYAPADGDILIFEAELPGGGPLLLEQVAAAARDYAAAAVKRARQQTGGVASGVLILEAKLPHAEREPISALTFLIDGDAKAATNSPPFTYDWDTRSVRNGEHVVEIDGLNSSGNKVTWVKALVVVSN